MLSNITFQEWCLRNNLNPNKNTSRTAFSHFMRALNTQMFISKITHKKQLTEDQQIMEQCL